MESIVAHIVSHAAVRPAAPALVDCGLPVGYGSLVRGVDAAASWLARRGVRPGDVVALSLEDSPSGLAAIELFYAVGWLGAVVLPLYPDVPPARRQALVSRFKAKAVTPREMLAEEGPLGGGTARADSAGQPFLLQFTSGTTGEPKIVAFTHAQMAAFMQATVASLAVTPADRLLSARPLPSLVGLRSAMMLHTAGAALVNAAVPETRSDLAMLIDQHGLTMLTASPWQARRLLHSATLTGGGLARLRVLTIVGAAIAGEEIRAIRARLCRNAYVVYGSNEMGLAAMLRPEDPIAEDGRVGRIPPGMQGEAVDARGQALPPGEVGALRFKAAWIPEGYVDNPRATVEHFRDGWFYPGDLGAIDAEGWLAFRGRVDDVINFGGVKIMPSDLEAVLLEHPDVADAAVVGLPEPMAGEVPVAFVVTRRDLAASDLASHCRQRIDGTRLPIAFVAVPRIPRNEAGKVLREQLRTQYTVRAGAPS